MHRHKNLENSVSCDRIEVEVVMSLNNNANGRAAFIVLESAKNFGNRVDQEFCNKRHESAMFSNFEYVRQGESFQIPVEEVRFSNGEGKVVLGESPRGRDVYIFSDVGNHGITYQLYGKTTYMSPDEHFQNIKRVVSALSGKAKRITVVMPLLYASRQHRPRMRESSDCALALQELERLGVNSVITFDAHDPNVSNAIPLMSFQNIYPTYEIVSEILRLEDEIVVDPQKLIVISPDTGAMDRGLYYAGVLGLDLGVFYKRRDYTKIVGGKNPIVQHQYMGKPIEGMDVLITDDMISSGQSVLDVAKELKEMKANKIFIAVSFALFTNGFDKFTEYYEAGYFERVYATNLSYVPEELLEMPWYRSVDVSRYLALILDRLNRDESILDLLDSTHFITDLIK